MDTNMVVVLMVLPRVGDRRNGPSSNLSGWNTYATNSHLHEFPEAGTLTSRTAYFINPGIKLAVVPTGMNEHEDVDYLDRNALQRQLGIISSLAWLASHALLVR